MLGASQVGKSSLCAQFLSSEHINAYDKHTQKAPTRSIDMVSKPFVFDVFVVKSAQKVTLSIIVLMCVTINDLWMI